MKLPVEHYKFLRDVYLRYFPVDLPDESIKDYSNVILNKDLIKTTSPDERILNKLLDILIEKIQNQQRYQKLTLLKLIQHHLQPGGTSKETIAKLFFVFNALFSTLKIKLPGKPRQLSKM